MSEALPYGVVAPRGGAPRCAVRVGDDALDLTSVDPAFAAPTLNEFLAAPRSRWADVRAEIEQIVAGDPALIPLAECQVLMPIAIGDYVDFFSSIEHASNLGRLFRPEGDPLLPNWRHLPVAYHGRSATVVASGTPVRRPSGPLGPGQFGPTQMLDIELELGFVIGGPANRLGDPVPIDASAERIFGVVLVNDWSARDIQRWEYQPLGPFLAKSFATSVSPWIVPIEALEPYRVEGPRQEPGPLPYLADAEPRNYNLELEVELNGEVISRTNASGLYWSAAQQLAHASVNGAVIRPGDLHATGTISGAAPDQCGSLIEIGRPFLADGDEVVLRGRAGAVSLGDVAGRIEPASAVTVGGTGAARRTTAG